MFSGLAVFYAAYFHSGRILPDTFVYSEFIVSFTSLFSEPKQVSVPSFEAPGFHINEDSAVLFWFVVALFANVVACILALWHRAVIGKSRLFIPVLLGSLAICCCVVYVGYGLALDYHA
tara:strand:- start:140 stop:496 length:357 start_codon:yes stop_codon:yes gene_type:complete